MDISRKPYVYHELFTKIYLNILLLYINLLSYVGPNVGGQE